MTTACCIQKPCFIIHKNMDRLKVKGQKNISWENFKNKKAGRENYSNIGQSRLKDKNIIRDKEGHFMMMKEWIYHKVLLILNE